MRTTMTLFHAFLKGSSRDELTSNAINYLKSLEVSYDPKKVESHHYVYLVALPEYLMMRAKTNVELKLASRVQ